MSETDRRVELRVEVDAPPEVVWRAITDARELTRWFPLEARTRPGPGGSVWISWGEGFEWESRIAIWDPPRHLREESTREEAWGHEGRVAPVTISVDYHLEGRSGGSGTTIRLVHAGFGSGAAWDNEFDSVNNGWKFELRSLRHYLSRHAGKDRRVAWVRAGAPESIESAWALAAGALTGGAGPDPSALREGEAYSFASGLSGRVVHTVPGRQFVGTVASMNDALLRLEVERAPMHAMEGAAPGACCGPCVWLAAWGHGAGLEAFGREWEERMRSWGWSVGSIVR